MPIKKGEGSKIVANRATKVAVFGDFGDRRQPVPIIPKTPFHSPVLQTKPESQAPQILPTAFESSSPTANRLCRFWRPPSTSLENIKNPRPTTSPLYFPAFFALFFILLFSPAFAQFGGGGGSDLDPYIITSATHLNNIRGEYLNKHYIQMADIDLAGSGYTNWDPIGTQSNPFKGNYNGNNFKITNLTIDRSDDNNIGLFGYFKGAKLENICLENICLENVNVKGNQHVGGLVGYAYNGVSISECFATGAVEGNNSVGGLAGRAYDGVSISECYATGAVEGGSYVGGLVGNAFEGVSISECYASGSVEGNYEVGGLVGYAGYDLTISNCYASGAVEGNSIVGGLVGYVWSSSTISKCYASGAVEGNSFVGGLLGYASETTTNCFWDIDTTGQTISAGGTGKTTAQMKTKSTFTDAGWDFDEIWQIDAGTYPYLRLSDGGGTPDSPYEIWTADDLNAVRTKLDKSFIQMADIDLADSEYSDNWEPIGDFDNPFKGSFNGNNFKISGLNIDRPSQDDIGLFGYIDGARLENICLEGVVVKGQLSVGGLIGKVESSDIKNCYATGSVKGYAHTGVLIGYATSPSTSWTTVENCYASGLAESEHRYTGILIGRAVRITVKNCYAIGSAESQEPFAGILIGHVNSTTAINCYASGSVSASSNIGGLIGGGDGSSNNVIITSCYWDKQVSGQSLTYQDKGTGLPTVNMMKEESFEGWDFGTIWQIDQDESYPYFRPPAPVQSPPPIPEFVVADGLDDPIIERLEAWTGGARIFRYYHREADDILVDLWAKVIFPAALGEQNESEEEVYFLYRKKDELDWGDTKEAVFDTHFMDPGLNYRFRLSLEPGFIGPVYVKIIARFIEDLAMPELGYQEAHLELNPLFMVEEAPPTGIIKNIKLSHAQKGINISGAELAILNSTFCENQVGIMVEKSLGSRFHYNHFYNNGAKVEGDSGGTGDPDEPDNFDNSDSVGAAVISKDINSRVDARYNYWHDNENGPKIEKNSVENPSGSGNGDLVSGNITISPWAYGAIETINGDQNWPGQYQDGKALWTVILDTLEVENCKLVINDSLLKVMNNRGIILKEGSQLEIKGNGQEKAFLTAFNHDTGETLPYAGNSPKKGDWGGIRGEQGTEFNAENLNVAYGRGIGTKGTVNMVNSHISRQKDFGILAEGGFHVDLHSVTIKDCDDFAISLNGESESSDFDGSDLDISDCQRGLAGTGNIVMAISDSHLSDCPISGISAVANGAHSPASVNILNARIENCGIKDSSAPEKRGGILLEGITRNISIESCEISHAQYGIYASDFSGDLTVSGSSLIEGCDDGGIMVLGDGNGDIGQVKISGIKDSNGEIVGGKIHKITSGHGIFVQNANLKAEDYIIRNCGNSAIYHEFSASSGGVISEHENLNFRDNTGLNELHFKGISGFSMKNTYNTSDSTALAGGHNLYLESCSDIDISEFGLKRSRENGITLENCGGDIYLTDLNIWPGSSGASGWGLNIVNPQSAVQSLCNSKFLANNGIMASNSPNNSSTLDMENVTVQVNSGEAIRSIGLSLILDGVDIYGDTGIYLENANLQASAFNITAEVGIHLINFESLGISSTSGSKSIVSKSSGQTGIKLERDNFTANSCLVDIFNLKLENFQNGIEINGGSNGIEEINLKGVNLDNNTEYGLKTDNAGGIYVIENCSFENNKQGGALFMENVSSVDILHSTIISNGETGKGSGIKFQGVSQNNLKIDNCKLTDNTGPGLYVRGAFVQMNNCNIHGNGKGYDDDWAGSALWQFTQQESGTTSDINDICFTGTDFVEGWAVGENGLVLNTKNEGQVWIFEDPLSDSGGTGNYRDINYTAVDFNLDGSRGYIVGNTQSGITRLFSKPNSAGEAKWQVYNDFQPSCAVKRLQALENNYFFAVTEKAVALFEVKPNSIVKNNYKEVASSILDGYLTGDSSNFEGFFSLEYKEGLFHFAANGDEVPLVKAQVFDGSGDFNDYPCIHSIDFANDLVGVAVGEDGNILQTTNGGESWFKKKITEFPTNGGPVLNKVRLLADGRGIIAGERGLILASQPKVIGYPPHIQHFDIDTREVLAFGEVVVSWVIGGADKFDTVEVTYRRERGLNVITVYPEPVDLGPGESIGRKAVTPSLHDSDFLIFRIKAINQWGIDIRERRIYYSHF